MIVELLAGGVAGVFGHQKSRDFVRRRLRYTGFVQRSSTGMGLAAGAATALVAAPLAAVLPIVGAPAALIVSAGVGTGVAVGIKQARKGSSFDD